MGINRVLLVIGRQKWIILAFTIVGIFGAVIVWRIEPPLYVSEAKLILRYLADSKEVDPKEREILTSRDIATRTVTIVGPGKVLSRNGGGNNAAAAAQIVSLGLEVTSSPSSVIRVSFKNRDKSIVQPVLDALIHAYMHKHLELHNGAAALDEYWLKLKNLAETLTQTEEALTKAKTEAGVPLVDGSEQWYETRIAKAQSELDAAARDLGEEHRLVASKMKKLEEEEHRLLYRGYRETHPLVQSLRQQLRDLSVEKAKLEREFPELNQVSLGGTVSSPNSATGDVVSRLLQIKSLSARVTYLGNSLSNLQAQAKRVRELEPKIGELERERSQSQQSYESAVARLSKVMQAAAGKDDHVINISVVQNPSPPRLVWEKMLRLASSALAGCIAIGVGLAFLLDLVLKRGSRWDSRRIAARHRPTDSTTLPQTKSQRLRVHHF